MFVNTSGQGVVFGDIKSFIVEHPTRPGYKIVYISLEGPEAGMYDRGIVQLIDGRATIELPEHFAALANEQTITVQLTPGSLDSKGLAVGSIREGWIEIGELAGGTGSYDVHYLVHAVRRGFEDHQVVITEEEFKAQFAPAVDMSFNRASLNQRLVQEQQALHSSAMEESKRLAD